MNHYSKLFVALTLSANIYSHVNAQSTTPYKREIDEWHNTRVQSLKSENGWLNLVGLYWLEEGQNTFGSGNKNKVVFPAGTIDETAGYFERKGNSVKLVAASNVDIKINNKRVSEAEVFSPDSLRPPTMSHGNLRWSIIKRDDKIGIRLRNLKSGFIDSFAGIERFAVDPSWKVVATLQTDNQPASLFITNVLGQTNKEKSAGKVSFEINGQQYALDALDEGDKLFILFGDATSGESTYPSGRFLYASKPDANGKTTIDFNKAYNPPCAFTDFATCPLPPKQNILPVPITAGEKNFEHHK